MLKKALILVVALGLGSVAFATPTITVGDILFPPLGEEATGTITLSGSAGNIYSIDMILVIENPALIGGTDTSPPCPEIVSIDLGPAWNGTGAIDSFYNDFGWGPEPMIAGNAGLTSAGKYINDGLIFTYTIRYLVPGRYNVFAYAESTYLNGGTVECDLVPGIIGIPEPATLGLLACGLVMLRRRVR